MVKPIKEFNMKKEFESPKDNLENDKNNKWYKTWNGEILIVGNIYKVGKEFCVYAGDFKTNEEAPPVFCCYTIGDEMKIRHININIEHELPLRERKRKVEDDRPIDTTIKDTDNTLMILLKTALQYKNIVRGDFRQFYPNVSDMNNILRCIEKGDNLSWARFTDLLEKLHIPYNLSIYDEHDVIINKA
jgi:hypothetical protein